MPVTSICRDNSGSEFLQEKIINFSFVRKSPFFSEISVHFPLYNCILGDIFSPIKLILVRFFGNRARVSKFCLKIIPVSDLSILPAKKRL